MRATKPINIADISQLSSKKCTLAYQCAMTSITNKSESGHFERLVFCMFSYEQVFASSNKFGRKKHLAGEGDAF